MSPDLNRFVATGPHEREFPRQENSHSGRNASREAMANAYQLPPPSTGVGISSRTPLLSDPKPRLMEASASRNMDYRSQHTEPGRSAWREQLPPVSQLLTPVSQPAMPHSPFSSYSITSSESMSGQPSPHHSTKAVPCEPARALTRPERYTSTPIPPFHRESSSVSNSREGAQITSAVMQYPFPYIAHGEFGTRPYPDVLEQTRHPSATQRSPNRLVRNPESTRESRAVMQRLAMSPVSATEQTKRDPIIPSPALPLPRVVAEEIVPGEGPCYIYEDGSRCKKVIDGEVVNAQWGVTKTGKPRKRLAIACMTCREKKIKCDPGDLKCVQCDKFGRECRFQTAPRGHHGSPDTPAHEHRVKSPSPNTLTKSQIDSDLSTMYSEIPPLEQTLENSRRKLSSDSKPSKRTQAHSTSPPAERPFSKRRRQPPQEPQDSSFAQLAHQLQTTSPSRKHSDVELGKAGNIDFSPRNDPFAVDPELTLHYMGMYMDHVNAANYRIFPRGAFLLWLKNSMNKSPEDIMLIYVMLALGTVFSNQPDRQAHGTVFQNIAIHAEEKQHGKFSLQGAQTRILLALQQNAVGGLDRAWDYVGQSMRAVSALRLNFEDGCTDIQLPFSYGLNRVALAECRRRTFWSAYLMDAIVNGTCSTHLRSVSDSDIFIRLPSSDTHYESQSAASAPFFPNPLIDPALTNTTPKTQVSPMAHLITLASIWASVIAQTHHANYLSPATYFTTTEIFYEKILARLESWMASLPSHLRFSPTNTAACHINNSLDSYFNLHTLYHTTHMILNRHVRTTLLPTHIVSRNIIAAHKSAKTLLQMMHTLSNIEQSLRLPPPPLRRTTPPPLDQDSLPVTLKPQSSFSTPFAGLAITTASDILSAAGSLQLPAVFEETIKFMNGGLAVLEALSRFWVVAKVQRRKLMRRIEALVNMVMESDLKQGRVEWNADGGVKGWVVTDAMMGGLGGTDGDLFYGEEDAGMERLCKGLGLEGEVIVLEERTGRKGNDGLRTRIMRLE